MEKANYDYQAGLAKGTTQEKSKELVEKAQHTAHDVQEAAQEVGKQVHAKGQEAVEAVKINSTGVNK